MKQKQWKYIGLSFIIIAGWILYAFFDYLLGESDGFNRLGLFFFWSHSFLFTVGYSLILLLFRIILFKTWNRKKITFSFIYLFTGIVNLVMFVIWCLTFIFGLLPFKIVSLSICGVQLIFSISIFSDMYVRRRLLPMN